ncbi:uncharacterized protein LOC143204120 [Rhynchophorus ferrugineus]|uniref:uncharacterized protein LOC143204120 n=1 Tax=Rhynchophorus ferrugineus TaxID=354439 RepID=UPI003FCE2CDB
MSKLTDKFSAPTRPSSHSKIKRVFISYSSDNTRSTEVLTPKSQKQSESTNTGVKKLIVIEKLKQHASFHGISDNKSNESSKTVIGKLSPGCKREIFIARKKSDPDVNNVNKKTTNFVCFSNNVC